MKQNIEDIRRMANSKVINTVRKICIICNSKRTIKNLVTVYIPLIQDYKFYCPECLQKVVGDDNIIVLDRGAVDNSTLYSDWKAEDY